MRILSPSIRALVTLLACDKGEPVTEGGTDTVAPVVDTFTPEADDDGDGWTQGNGDCDDASTTTFPGATETCNGVDDNCNGATDEGFGDADADGTKDCLDTEECDGVDNNGDGVTDEGFPDTDGDGKANCVSPEVCNGVDDNENGEIDEGFDGDGDGYTSCGSETVLADCDDNDASVNPGASEVDGDLADNNCDGIIDTATWAEGQLMITEIMRNPGNVLDGEGEWFEVLNTSGATVVLNGLVISSTVDADWHQVTSEAILSVGPGEYFVFGNNDDVLTNGGVVVDYMYADIGLANEDDSIVISGDSLIMDEVTWDDGITFPDGQGAAMNLDPTWLAPDLNDNGDYWCDASLFWDAASDFGTPGAGNEFCYPVPVIDYDRSASLDTCSALTLIGAGSYDPEGAAITYEWELVGAPATSTITSADITDQDSMNPTVTPDVAGDYTFSLTVYNGVEYSPPVTMTLTFATRGWNTAPTANAGTDQSYSESQLCRPISYGVSYSCTDCSDYDFDLDGSNSTDPDGDWLGDPTWTVTSSTGTASITGDDTWTPTVTVTGPTTVYGSTVSTVTQVRLDVVDCMGATASDSVQLTFACTGYR
jgi:hypothetical protein